MRPLDRNQCAGIAFLVSTVLFTVLSWGLLIALARLVGVGR